MTKQGTIHNEANRQRYVAEGLWKNGTLLDIFDEHVRTQPDKLLVVAAGGIRWSYKEVAQRVAVLAANMAQLGVGPGDVVSAQLPNWGEFLLIHLAASRLGAITNGLLPIYRTKDISHILRLARTKLAIIPNVYREHDFPAMYREVLPELPDLAQIYVIGGDCPADMKPFAELLKDQGAPAAPRREFDGDDMTILIFTSGTESLPKGVMHSHNTLLYGNMAGAKRLGLTRDEVIWAVSPITHATGIHWTMRQAVYLGATVVIQESWDAHAALDLIEQERCTYTCAATPFATMLIDAQVERKRDTASFRVFLCGGAAIPATLGAEMRKEIGCDLIPCWGMSECFAATMGSPADPDNLRWGSDGSALPGSETAIFDEDRKGKLGAGEVGEIATRGPHVCLGYYRDPERTADTFSEDGWLFSGDLGTMSAQGYLNVVGRKKDIINRGGLKISAREVEDMVAKHPAVKQVAMVGVTDRRLGEKSCAFVVLREGHQLDLGTLTAFLDGLGIAKYKLPEFVRPLDQLPMTLTGKVQKFKLKEVFEKSEA